MKKTFFLIFILLYSYAILRYHLGKNVPWNEWFYILNKAIAWTGFTLICLSVLPQQLLNNIKTTRRELGIQGFVFAAVHATSVLLLFNSNHYPKFYTANIINPFGWLILTIGFLSLVIFVIPFISALKKLPNNSKVFRMGKVGVLISVFHPLLIGLSGWFSPEEWPFYLPPITLLAVLFCLAIFMLRSFSKKK